METYRSKYLGEFPLEKVLASPELFDTIMERVVSVALERALINVPRLIISQVKAAETTRVLVEKFYLDNRDLRPYKEMVATTVTQLGAQHLDKTFEEILEMAATDVRAKVGIKSKA
jgi:hypothetical protein